MNARKDWVAGFYIRNAGAIPARHRVRGGNSGTSAPNYKYMKIFGSYTYSWPELYQAARFV